MYFSAEARWFFPGPASDAAGRWIVSGEYATRQDERTDRYLVMPGSDVVGIKLREGNFEVKSRSSLPEAVTWSSSIAGYRDTWVKWSCPAGGFADEIAVARAGETWLDVSKQRCIRLFSLESGSPVEVAMDGSRLAAGCLVEMCVIRTASGDYWSFCFEAFGEPGARVRHLGATIRHVAAEAPSLELPQEASMSYPAWLASLVG